jgi:hypothetical protein
LKESVNEQAVFENGQTYVYCGKPNSGKSAAGAAIIEMALDHCFEHKVQHYPYLFIDAGRDLKANMRRQLGVPDSIKNDNDWLALLFEKLKLVEVDPVTSHSTDEQEESDSTWWWDKLTTLCGGGSSNDFEEYVNRFESFPPIIGIDDFRLLDVTSYELLRKIYQRAARSRVMVFVLTDDEVLADQVAGMKGKERVLPLPGRFTVMNGERDWQIVGKVIVDNPLSLLSAFDVVVHKSRQKTVIRTIIN